MTSTRTLTKVSLIVAVVMVGLVIVVSSINHANRSTLQHRTPTTISTACNDNPNLNDYQMDMCLTKQIHTLRGAIAAALNRQISLINASAPGQGLPLVTAAQKDFDLYVRSECLAESAPYNGGTIVPIIFGNCEVSLYQQRLTLIRSQSSLAG